MAGRAKENLPGGSLKYLFVYFKVRIFKCSYRILHYPCTPPTLFGVPCREILSPSFPIPMDDIDGSHLQETSFSTTVSLVGFTEDPIHGDHRRHGLAGLDEASATRP